MNILWSDWIEADKIALSKMLYNRLSRPDTITVRYGLMEKILHVVVETDLSFDTICLPKNLSDTYTIPTEIQYECFIKNKKVHIGPVIAVVILGSFKKLTQSTLSLFLPRFQEYKKIKGMIYICTKDSINIGHSFVEGYYYNPVGEKHGNPWSYGRFPLPNAVFNRSFISQATIRALQQEIGDVLFNSYWFALNKWLIWERLSKDRKLKKHLPYTEKFTGIVQLNALLKKYDSLYIKPCSLSRGRGIIKVLKTNGGLLLIDEKKQNYFFQDDESISAFLKDKVTRPYIVQQAVPFSHGNQCIDFRVYLQKNEKKEWALSGVIARISQEGSIITNSQGRSELLSGRDVLAEVYKMDQRTAGKVEKRMIKLVKRAVKIYQKKGFHLGDVAADVILDNNLHLWLLELQLNYGAEKVPDKIPPDILKEVMITPFKYAKALAGFK